MHKKPDKIRDALFYGTAGVTAAMVATLGAVGLFEKYLGNGETHPDIDTNAAHNTVSREEATKTALEMTRKLHDPSVGSNGIKADFLKGSVTLEDKAGSVTYDHAVVLAYNDGKSKAEFGSDIAWVGVPTLDENQQLVLVPEPLEGTADTRIMYDTPTANGGSPVTEGTIHIEQTSDEGYESQALMADPANGDMPTEPVQVSK
jgi:hypothetical protein